MAESCIPIRTCISIIRTGMERNWTLASTGAAVDRRHFASDIFTRPGGLLSQLLHLIGYNGKTLSALAHAGAWSLEPLCQCQGHGLALRPVLRDEFILITQRNS